MAVAPICELFTNVIICKGAYDWIVVHLVCVASTLTPTWYRNRPLIGKLDAVLGHNVYRA